VEYELKELVKEPGQFACVQNDISRSGKINGTLFLFMIQSQINSFYAQMKIRIADKQYLYRNFFCENVSALFIGIT
jgi:hypothetical protein